MEIKLILTVLLIGSECVISVTPLLCYWNTGCPYRYFSSKTPYNMLRGDIRDSVVKLPGCEPVSVWGLVRHGKRYPGAFFGKLMKEVLFIREQIVSDYENGNSSFCAQDVENLKKWAPEKDFFDKPSYLSEEGYQELVGIGQRLKQAFPKLLAQLDKGNYTFRPVRDKWTEDSIQAFVEGFGFKNLFIEPPRDGYDYTAPYKSCGKYLKIVKHSNNLYLEAEKYLNSSEFLTLKDRIQRKLGIHSITDDDIIALWDLCRYTSNGIQLKFSPWCALFTTEDLEVLEYTGDLRHYYRTGYGVPMKDQQFLGQIVLADLLRSFHAVKEGLGNKITTYIVQSTMTDMAFTALGLFKDASPITGDVRNPNRKWRSSKISMFSTNLMAVLNKCTKGDDDYNVVFYLNEEPLRTICKEGVCSWREFEHKLSPFLKTNLDFCEDNSTSYL